MIDQRAIKKSCIIPEINIIGSSVISSCDDHSVFSTFIGYLKIRPIGDGTYSSV